MEPCREGDNLAVMGFPRPQIDRGRRQKDTRSVGLPALPRPWDARPKLVSGIQDHFKDLQIPLLLRDWKGHVPPPLLTSL